MYTYSNTKKGTCNKMANNSDIAACVSFDTNSSMEDAVDSEQKQKKQLLQKKDEYVAPMSIEAIEKRVAMLLDQIPSVARSLALSPTNVNDIEAWCRECIKISLRFGLLIQFIHLATYQWQTEKTGNSCQNLSALVNEANEVQRRLKVVTASCNSVLYPSLDTYLTKVTSDDGCGGDDYEDKDENEVVLTTADDGEPGLVTAMTIAAATSAKTNSNNNIRTNHYVYQTEIKYPDSVQMARQTVCDEAIDYRYLMALSLETMLKAFKDYRKAAANEGSRSDMAM